jgi:hypothetical protein
MESSQRHQCSSCCARILNLCTELTIRNFSEGPGTVYCRSAVRRRNFLSTSCPTCLYGDSVRNRSVSQTRDLAAEPTISTPPCIELDLRLQQRLPLSGMRHILTFWKNVLLLCFTLEEVPHNRHKAIMFLRNFCHTIRCHIPEDGNIPDVA